MAVCGPPCDPAGLEQRLARLDALLAAHDWLWRPLPFRTPRPDWTGRLPALAAEVLALDDADVARLAGDDGALIGLAARHLPALGELAGLVALPQQAAAEPAPHAHLSRDIPGRKLAQIGHFAAAVAAPVAPVVEWCAGKGHLGRWLAASRGAEVLSLDHDPALCAAGASLAGLARPGVQRFVQADALAAHTGRLLAGRHVVALHACGDLHRALIEGAVSAGAAAVDVAPCCYPRTVAAHHRPLSGTPGLRVQRDDLRLAVADSVTAPPREIRLRMREAAWKLGFVALRRRVTEDHAYRSFRPVPQSWLKADFATFCRQLAAREGVALPASLPWGEFEAAGLRRNAEVMRLSLPRLAFRRALEVWLVLDAALYLGRHGYAVEVLQFCRRAETPRNLMIRARRQAA
ncbi:MAG: methyltransferase [Betaproteobacteria bacterium]|nr:methyltransferase [Betaproteobacteria bacterium]